jgi:hypothetical protein
LSKAPAASCYTLLKKEKPKNKARRTIRKGAKRSTPPLKPQSHSTVIHKTVVTQVSPFLFQ